jgi:hypothetical protein
MFTSRVADKIFKCAGREDVNIPNQIITKFINIHSSFI